MIDDDEEEDSALVDSFFLPGGILDPLSYQNAEEDAVQIGVDDIQHVPFTYQKLTVPAQNPWSTSGPSWEPIPSPQSDSTTWPLNAPLTSSLLEEQQQQALSSPMSRDDPLIGNPSYDVTQRPIGPLHLPTTRPTTNFPRSGGNQNAFGHSFMTTLPNDGLSLTRSNRGNDFVQGLIPPFRPPPGFEDTQGSLFESFLDDERPRHQGGEGSVRSNSSVPHELFDGDTFTLSSASSLSASTCSNDESLQSQSSQLQDTVEDEPRNVYMEDAYEDCEVNVNRPSQETVEQEVEEASGLYCEQNLENVEASNKNVARTDSADTKLHSPVPSLHQPKHPPKQKKLTTRTEPTTHQKQLEEVKGEVSATITSRWALSGAGNVFVNAESLVFFILSGLRYAYQAMVARCRLAVPYGFQLVQLTLSVIRIGVKGMVLFVSLSLHFYRSAFMEAFEEAGVAVCFFSMYLAPSVISFLMEFIILPHWTPHLLSSALLYGLCHAEHRNYEITQNQINSQDKKEFVRLALKTNKNEPNHDGDSLLRLARYSLPFVAIVDGFSSELGSIMSLSGGKRLIIAFILSAFRIGLHLSPLIWWSWSVQVLMASYFPSNKVFELSFVVLGLASVRYARFLESEKAALTSKQL